MVNTAPPEKTLLLPSVVYIFEKLWIIATSVQSTFQKFYNPSEYLLQPRKDPRLRPNFNLSSPSNFCKGAHGLVLESQSVSTALPPNMLLGELNLKILFVVFSSFQL